MFKVRRSPGDVSGGMWGTLLRNRGQGERIQKPGKREIERGQSQSGLMGAREEERGQLRGESDGGEAGGERGGTSGTYEEGGQQRGGASGSQGSRGESGEETGNESGTSSTYEERCLPADWTPALHSPLEGR